jgi:hypothetical protein
MGRKEGRYGTNEEEDSVRTTSTLTTERRKQVNQYTRHERIGKGQHGEVFLCSDESGQKMVRLVLIPLPCPLTMFALAGTQGG